ncbi:histidine phosphatase superfamily [Podospora appendiculata]|uniref:Histidine phosphatase superfamily n=1 Tax=Podospora appendiculata TaxID=314037 RepID=A0AAE0X3G8_9PEZI|nr:histidine phosphatase superfamily [Podospora appendiculata]
MASKIYVVRHAESAHNVSKDFNLRDPGLTELGLAQSVGLATSFPALSSVAVVLASPLSRTIETTLAAFGAIIDKRHVGSDIGEEGGAELILDPGLQERSDLPCDTGSDVATLKSKYPDLDLAHLETEWYLKKGEFTADDAAVEARARALRRKLKAIVDRLGAEGDNPHAGKRDIVVVTHGVFMKFLVQDETIDLPKAGWRVYTIIKEGDGDAVSLVANDQ